MNLSTKQEGIVIMNNSNNTPLFNIVEADNTIVEHNLTQEEAERLLCWHLNHDADVYLQEIL